VPVKQVVEGGVDGQMPGSLPNRAEMKQFVGLVVAERRLDAAGVGPAITFAPIFAAQPEGDRLGGVPAQTGVDGVLGRVDEGLAGVGPALVFTFQPRVVG